MTFDPLQQCGVPIDQQLAVDMQHQLLVSRDNISLAQAAEPVAGHVRDVFGR
jgi:hypothetical protein